MIKLTKEQKERIKELERIEEEHAGEEEYRRSQESENEDFDNEEEKYDGYNEYNKYYDETEPYDDYEQELRNNEEDDDESDDHIDDSGFLEEQEAERKAEQKQEEEDWAEQLKYEKELRASIAFEKQDGSIISSVVEKWGEQLGWTLIEHFNDEKSALKVSEVGSIDHKEDDVSELQQTIKKLIQKKNKKNRTKELQVFDNFDEYDKYIKDTTNFDCAFLWRNESWEFLDWFFEYEQNDFGVDITKDEYLSRLVLSSTSLKKEKNKSKFIKIFGSNGNWGSLSRKFPVRLDETSDG
jgi:hypothetical protein